jgi:serine/arginine repetitive matrix protein 1
MDPKLLHVELQPFLEKNTALFMKELWTLLASASANESGVPQQLLDEKAEELRAKREKEAAIQVGLGLGLGRGAAREGEGEGRDAVLFLGPAWALC